MDAVRRTALLDTAAEYVFNRLVTLAAALFAAPIAVMTIVDSDRIWFKARHGIDVTQIGRDPGLCGSAILQDEPWVVSDARNDPRSRDNPLVTGPLALRFYAGIPLKLSDGHRIGTLCVIDQKPRTVDEVRMNGLKDLASLAVEQIELRILLRRVSANLREGAQAQRLIQQHAEAQLHELEVRVQTDVSTMADLAGHPVDVSHLNPGGLPEVYIDGIPLGLPGGDLGGLATLIEGFLAAAVTRGAERIDIEARPDGNGLSLTVRPAPRLPI